MRAVIVGAVLAVILASTAVAQTNILKNGDFSSGPSGDSITTVYAHEKLIPG